AAATHRGMQIELRNFSVGEQFTVEAANHFLAHSEIHDAHRTFANRRQVGSRRFQVERYLAGNGKTIGLDLLKVPQRQGRADQVSRKILRRNVVGDAAGDDARAADFLSRRKDAKFSVADAGLVRLEVKLAAQAVEFKSVDLSLREVEQAGDRG